MDRIELEPPTAVLRPEQSRDDESHGGAIARERYLAIQSVTLRKKNTGMEWGTRRAHQGRKQRRSRPGNGVELKMADVGGVVELQARCGVSGAPLTPQRGWMEAERCAASTYIARRRSN
jgi:hypothetical protein